MYQFTREKTKMVKKKYKNLTKISKNSPRNYSQKETFLKKCRNVFFMTASLPPIYQFIHRFGSESIGHTSVRINELRKLYLRFRLPFFQSLSSL